MLERFDTEDDLIATAHLVYAAYAAHNTFRHSSPTPSPASTLACLRRFTQQAVFHKQPALRSLEGAKRARPTADLPGDLRIIDGIDTDAPPLRRVRLSIPELIALI